MKINLSNQAAEYILATTLRDAMSAEIAFVVQVRPDFEQRKDEESIYFIDSDDFSKKQWSKIIQVIIYNY
jgi:hypothetical protein